MRIWGKIGIFALCTLAVSAQGAYLFKKASDPKRDRATYNQIVELERTTIPAFYPQIRDVSLEIFRRFPPEQYYYVGIGRSPTPILAFMEAYELRGQKTIPISYLKNYSKDKRLTPETDAKLQEHFRKFLPGKEELAGRKLLLIDYVHAGESIKKTIELIEGTYPKEALEIFAVGHTSFTPPEISVRIHRSGSAPNALFTGLFQDEKFDDWAKYKQFDAHEAFKDGPLPAPIENSDYEHLKSAIAKQVANDPLIGALRYKAECAARWAQLK